MEKTAWQGNCLASGDLAFLERIAGNGRETSRCTPCHSSMPSPQRSQEGGRRTFAICVAVPDHKVAAIRKVLGTSSAYSERIGGGHYLEIEPDRAAIARYGLSIADVEEVVATALGGETVTTAVEGRERYGVIVRYPRDLRDNPQAIASDVSVSASNAMVPLGQVAAIRVTQGPPSIRTENAELVAYLYVGHCHGNGSRGNCRMG